MNGCLGCEYRDSAIARLEAELADTRHAIALDDRDYRALRAALAELEGRLKHSDDMCATITPLFQELDKLRERAAADTDERNGFLAALADAEAALRAAADSMDTQYAQDDEAVTNYGGLLRARDAARAAADRAKLAREGT